MTMGKEEEGERAEGFVRAPIYSVIHLPVVDVMCVLFWTQSVCMVPNQNRQNIYHERMKNGVERLDCDPFTPPTLNQGVTPSEWGFCGQDVCTKS